jgi:1,4-dihydroxy-2-naphthoate octaprenyltransferase
MGWLYSTPPVQLNAKYLGETVIALGTGIAVPAVGFISLYGKLTASFLTFIVPMILYGYILSLSLELPDLETDRIYGRKNLVVLLDRRLTALLILLLSITAFTYFMTGIAHGFKTPLILPALAVAPILASLHGLMKRSISHYDANLMSVYNISALFLFLVCLNGYLLYQLF